MGSEVTPCHAVHDLKNRPWKEIPIVLACVILLSSEQNDRERQRKKTGLPTSQQLSSVELVVEG